MPFTRLSSARPASQFVPPLLCGALAFAILVACGGVSGDSVTGPPKLVNTGPGNTGTPDVRASTCASTSANASTCTPVAPPLRGGGTVILEAFVDSAPVKFYQNGTRIQAAYLNFPYQEADTGQVDVSGKLAMGISGKGSKENLRADSLQFYVDLTGTFNLTRADASSPYKALGSYTYIYHKDAASAPVYATCTRTIQITLRKTS